MVAGWLWWHRGSGVGWLGLRGDHYTIDRLCEVILIFGTPVQIGPWLMMEIILLALKYVLGDRVARGVTGLGLEFNRWGWEH